ncbi:MAG: hypothetical protein II122_02645 [Bacteroidaceae bacterium]|nr:hypothetical protein [Bacteroidaceae bacterium]
MRKLLVKVVILALISSFGMTSCNSETDYTTTNYGSNHCAVTYMLLGTLYRDIHTQNSSGKDSVYTTTMSGSQYMLYIDQYKGEIYNPDSLPLGTRTDKVVFSSVSYDGILAYRTENGTDTLYSTGDTIDFTNPRLFTCFSYSGSAKKTYTVHINVHQVNTEAFVWNQVHQGLNHLQALTSQRAFYKGDTIYVFALADNAPVRIAMPIKENVASSIVDTLSLAGFKPENVQQFGNKFYTLENGVVMTSSDGAAWTAANTTFTADALVAVSSTMIFATKEGKMYHSEDAVNWELDEIESHADKLPTSAFTSAWAPMLFNENFEYLICGGTNADGNVEWRKVIDNKGHNTEPWSLYQFGEEKAYPYPAGPNVQILAYDSKMFAMGTEGDTLSLFYVSTDMGRTWRPQRNSYQHPHAIKASNFSWAIDDEKYIWIICGGSGEIWRGRINRLGFQPNQTAFTE